MDMEQTNKLHTFVICAYRESEYLEECIRSLLGQTVQSRILIATSTPNETIRAAAEKYSLPLFINDGPSSIAHDWNFAYEKAETPYLTIAHQDDVYLPGYTEAALKAFAKAKRPLIFFSDYSELREGKAVSKSRSLRIKRLLLLPMRAKVFQKSRFIRRRCLSLGNPIGCPAVSYAKDNLPNPVFRHGFRSNLDWEAWEMLSKLDGAFLYTPESLMLHRVHEGSETSAVIRENVRTGEDFEMFCKFWPKWMAKFLNRFYSKSENSNRF